MTESEKLTKQQRYWLTHIQASHDNQQSLKVYAREHGLNITSMYDAKKQLKRKGILEDTRPQRFVRVTTPVVMQPVASCRVLLVNGTVVELSCGIEEIGRVLETAARLG
ncbi:MAG TPA: hypothetical protein VIK64_11655 [Anaerolineales bacterium]